MQSSGTHKEKKKKGKKGKDEITSKSGKPAGRPHTGKQEPRPSSLKTNGTLNPDLIEGTAVLACYIRKCKW